MHIPVMAAARLGEQTGRQSACETRSLPYCHQISPSIAVSSLRSEIALSIIFTDEPATSQVFRLGRDINDSVVLYFDDKPAGSLADATEGVFFPGIEPMVVDISLFFKKTACSDGEELPGTAA